jgi:hypothetical protein
MQHTQDVDDDMLGIREQKVRGYGVAYPSRTHVMLPEWLFQRRGSYPVRILDVHSHRD